MLRAAVDGNAGASEDLLAVAYGELRRIAGRMLASERHGHTLEPTALVHEAWLKLIDQQDVEWRCKAHFLAIAAQAMRRILIDHARTKGRDKRGGGRLRVTLSSGIAQDRSEESDLLNVDAALSELERMAPRQARLVELRFFAGLQNKELAEVLEVSESTIEREWRIARAWLSSRIQPV